MTTEERLREGIAALDLPRSVDELAPPLLEYLDMLLRWNKAYNLTAVRDPHAMVQRHLLDSLAIAPLLSDEQQVLIDVGTGAGLPGVPLALVFPEREFHLLDSNGKKTRFLFQVKTALGFDNMVVHQARVETFSAGRPFDAVLSRDFASLGDMFRDCHHLLAPQGVCLAMKGACSDEELQALFDAQAQVTLHRLAVPGLDEQRHLVVIRPGEKRGAARVADDVC